MSIQDVETPQEREDEQKDITSGTANEDAIIQAEKLEQERLRKEKWVKWQEKWAPRIVKVLAVFAVIYLAYIAYLLLKVLLWVIGFGIVLMAVGAGMSEGGQESQARGNYYNQLRQDRPTSNPKYWKR